MYCLRHRETLRVMPEVKKGYSYVELGDWVLMNDDLAPYPPRFFMTARAAKIALTTWLKGHGTAENITGTADDWLYNGGDVKKVSFANVEGRGKREDFEAVEVRLEECFYDD